MQNWAELGLRPLKDPFLMLSRLGGSEGYSWFSLMFQKQVHPNFSANRCFREGSPRDIKQNGIWMETWHPSLETFFIGYRFGGGGG